MKKIFEDMQSCRLSSTNDPNKIAEINKQTHILTEVFNYTGIGGPEGALRRYLDYIAIHYPNNPYSTPNVFIQGQIRVDIFDRIMNAIGNAFPNYKLCCKIGYSI